MATLFSLSSEARVSEFDSREPGQSVRLDLPQAHFWTTTAFHALDRIVHKFRRNSVAVDVTGLN